MVIIVILYVIFTFNGEHTDVKAILYNDVTIQNVIPTCNVLRYKIYGKSPIQKQSSAAACCVGVNVWPELVIPGLPLVSFPDETSLNSASLRALNEFEAGRPGDEAIIGTTTTVPFIEVSLFQSILIMIDGRVPL